MPRKLSNATIQGLLSKHGSNATNFGNAIRIKGGTDEDVDFGINYFNQRYGGAGSLFGGGGGTPSSPSGGGGFNPFSTLLDKFNSVFKGMGNIAGDYYRTQFGQERSVGGPDKNVGQTILDMIGKDGFNPLKLLTSGISEVNNEILDQLTRESQLKNEINSKTTLTLKLSKQLREDILESAINAAEFGFTINELGELYTGLVEKSGRFGLINKDTMDLAAPVARSLSMSMSDLSETINEFEKVGKGANDTLETIFDVGRKSMTLGLSGRKIVSDLQTNLSKLNEYGFKNGVNGLAEMVRKSNEFRMSIEESFKIADKVMNPEGALELTANLQVLGGAIGDFNDPLKLMYMATNNVEGLQDALIGAAGSLTTYNQEQGKFEITGVNLRRAKEMATQLGISYQELAKGAIAAAERSAAASDLMMTGLRMDDEEKELLMNLARMEKGEMVIKIPQKLSDQFGLKTEIKLSEMTEGLKTALIKNADEIRELTPEDMARAQLTETQRMAGYLETIAGWGKRRGVQAFRGVLRGVGGEDFLKDKYESVRDKSLELRSKPNFYFDKKVELQMGIIKDRFGDEPINDAKKFWNNFSFDNLGQSLDNFIEIFKNSDSKGIQKDIYDQLVILNSKVERAKSNALTTRLQPPKKGEYLAEE